MSEVEQQPPAVPSNPDSYTIPKDLMNVLYNTLKFYGNLTSYAGERIGGVVAGCPRGPAPMPHELVRWANYCLNRIDREILDRKSEDPPFPPETTPAPQLRLWKPFRVQSPEGWPHLYVSLEDYDAGLVSGMPNGYRSVIQELPIAASSVGETSLHEGHRQSFLKAVELSLASGMLGDGDRSDLLDICGKLSFDRVSDVRLEALRSSVKAPGESVDFIVGASGKRYWRCSCKPPGDINIESVSVCKDCGTVRPAQNGRTDGDN